MSKIKVNIDMTGSHKSNLTPFKINVGGKSRWGDSSKLVTLTTRFVSIGGSGVTYS